MAERTPETTSASADDPRITQARERHEAENEYWQKSSIGTGPVGLPLGAAFQAVRDRGHLLAVLTERERDFSAMRDIEGLRKDLDYFRELRAECTRLRDALAEREQEIARLREAVKTFVEYGNVFRYRVGEANPYEQGKAALALSERETTPAARGGQETPRP